MHVGTEYTHNHSEWRSGGFTVRTCESERRSCSLEVLAQYFFFVALCKLQTDKGSSMRLVDDEQIALIVASCTERFKKWISRLGCLHFDAKVQHCCQQTDIMSFAFTRKLFPWLDSVQCASFIISCFSSPFPLPQFYVCYCCCVIPSSPSSPSLLVPWLAR